MDDAADAAGDDPIVALEKRFRSRIVALKRQLEDRERRATNAKYVNEANEALAAEATSRQILAESAAAQAARVARRVGEQNDAARRDRTLAALEAQSVRQTSEISRCETAIRDCHSDPILRLPAGTARRRELAKLEEELKELRSTQASVAARRDELRRTAALHEEMRVAAADGDAEGVIALLQRGVSVNAPDASGCSAVHYACRAGHAHVVERCIDAGADLAPPRDAAVGGALHGAASPLVVAAEHGHDEVVQLLCERGGAAQLHAADETGKTALHVACAKGHEHVARALLGAGAHANVVDRTGSTPLHVVAATKHVRLARLLVDRGADLTLRNREEHTALDAARAHENRAVIELLAPLVARALAKGAD